MCNTRLTLYQIYRSYFTQKWFKFSISNTETAILGPIKLEILRSDYTSMLDLQNINNKGRKDGRILQYIHYKNLTRE